MDKIEFYLISIKRSGIHRKENINDIKEMCKENLKELNISGFDGKNLNEEMIEKLKKLNILRKNNYRQIKRVKWKPELIDNELAVFISHFQMWKNISFNNVKYGIIFEDDAKFDENFTIDLSNILNNLPEEWDFISFFHHKNQLKDGRFEKYTEEFGNDYLLKLKGDLFGCVGYMINYKSSLKFINKLLPIKYPVDTAVMKYLIKRGTGYVSKKKMVSLYDKKTFIFEKK
jgi:GR25 family glycosyltransferase involved in LPS biosynthesis